MKPNSEQHGRNREAAGTRTEPRLVFADAAERPADLNRLHVLLDQWVVPRLVDEFVGERTGSRVRRVPKPPKKTTTDPLCRRPLVKTMRNNFNVQEQ